MKRLEKPDYKTAKLVTSRQVNKQDLLECKWEMPENTGDCWVSTRGWLLSKLVRPASKLGYWESSSD